MSKKGGYLLQKEAYNQKVIKILEGLSPKVVLETVVNIKDKSKDNELSKRCFAYLWDTTIPNKKEALIHLFIAAEFVQFDDISQRTDEGSFSTLIKNDDDPNIDIVKTMLTIPKEAFRNDTIWEISKKYAAQFFLNVAHYPKVFDFLMEIIEQEPNEENEHIIDTIYRVLLSEDYDTKVNSTLLFSKEQKKQTRRKN